MMIFRYREDNSIFHQIDPLSKFIWVLCMSVIAVTNESVSLQAALFVLIGFVGNRLTHITVREMWRGLRIPFVFGLPYFLLQLIFLPGQDVWLTVGSIDITKEAVMFAAAVTIRLLSLMLLSLVFVVSTDPRDVVLTLAQKCKVPYRIAYAVSIALRFLPLLESEAKTLRDALKRRGAVRSGTMRFRGGSWRFLLMVFGGAVQRVHHIALGMEMKGFGAHHDRTYIRTIIIPAKGKVLSVVSAGFMAAILLFY